MARPGLRKHRKFCRLQYSLGAPAPHVIGYLECMWAVGYECGDDLLGDCTAVEAVCEWPGEKGKLCAALLECGFIDQDEAGQFHIHDLLDHAPDYVKKRSQRESERKSSRKPRAADIVRQTADNGGQTADTVRRTAENGAPPTPTPTPTPLFEEENSAPARDLCTPTPEQDITQQPRQDCPESPSQWPQFLATEWRFYYRGCVPSQRDAPAGFFASLIQRGIPPADILRRIRDPARKNTEATFHFEKFFEKPANGKELNGHGRKPGATKPNTRAGRYFGD